MATRYIIGIIFFFLWLCLLKVLNKADLKFWHYISGAIGLFVLLMIFIVPSVTGGMAKMVALIASLPGRIFGWYSVYYKFGTIFIDSVNGALSVKIDFECSGIVEIIAYVSLLAFYRVYTINERIWIGLLGIIGIILANAVRIITVCTMIYFGGVNMYFIAHTIVGRIVFYAASVCLYFFVFTKSQIVKQKVGSFKYESNN